MLEPVILNVYDLSDYNSWLYTCGLGGEDVLKSCQVLLIWPG